MNCLECRRLTLINPDDEHPARLAHLESCPQCASFAADLQAQDELIREATTVDLPEGFAARILLNQTLQHQSRRPTRFVWLSLAASLLLAAVFLPSLIQDAFYRPFETELISHVNAHDVLAQHGGHEDVSSAAKIEKVLAASGAGLPADITNVIYASTCVVDGETMAHLLVEYGNNEYVVFLMPERDLDERQFQRAGWEVFKSSICRSKYCERSISFQG